MKEKLFEDWLKLKGIEKQAPKKISIKYLKAICLYYVNKFEFPQTFLISH